MQLLKNNTTTEKMTCIYIQGVFVAFVKNDSPAAYGGLRFGDQILQINDESVAGYSGEKVMKIIKSADPRCIKVAVRDR